MISILLVRKIAQLFLIMILGYLLVKLRILKTEESIVLSKLSLYLVMPAVILSAFQVDFKPEIQSGLILAFVAAVAIHILLLIIGHISGRLFHFEEIDIASIIYSNAGNLIIPIVTAVLGTEWVIYSTAFLSVQLIFLWTHCKLMFSKEKKPHFRKIILNVNMIAIFIGVLSMLSGSRLPAIILLLLKLSNAASLVNHGNITHHLPGHRDPRSLHCDAIRAGARQECSIRRCNQHHDHAAMYRNHAHLRHSVLYLKKNPWKLLKTSTSMFQGFFVKIYG